MNIRRNFIVVTQAVADGHGRFAEPAATGHTTHDAAVEKAKRWASNRAGGTVTVCW